jgi:phosphoribosylglycinamide formyltransferase-1
MARLAVLASGRGSNFVAIAERMRQRGAPHELALLVCDQPGAPVLDRAAEAGVPAHLVSYRGRPREEAEREILERLAEARIDVVALAGFMRMLSPAVLRSFGGEIINLHPSLLPKYAGTHGIEESWRSADRRLGISVIRIDEGVDTGPVLLQRSFNRTGFESLEEIEQRIHELEHEWFPAVVLQRLAASSGKGPAACALATPPGSLPRQGDAP